MLYLQDGEGGYRSREAQVKVREGCYARLVREWNGREGVRRGSSLRALTPERYAHRPLGSFSSN